MLKSNFGLDCNVCNSLGLSQCRCKEVGEIVLLKEGVRYRCAKHAHLGHFYDSSCDTCKCAANMNFMQQPRVIHKDGCLPYCSKHMAEYSFTCDACNALADFKRGCTVQQPTFKPGDVVRHKASGEVAVVIEVTNEFVRVSTNFSNESVINIPQYLIELASPSRPNKTEFR